MKYRHDLLREARMSKGWTQTQLAKKAKLSVAAINQIEAGGAPWLKAIAKIASRLELPLSDVLILPAMNGRRSA